MVFDYSTVTTIYLLQRHIPSELINHQTSFRETSGQSYRPPFGHTDKRIHGHADKCTCIRTDRLTCSRHSRPELAKPNCSCFCSCCGRIWSFQNESLNPNTTKRPLFVFVDLQSVRLPKLKDPNTATRHERTTLHRPWHQPDSNGHGNGNGNSSRNDN